uniref:Uncharacterized protein n=1 Tax=Anguilla anguilla TaxID=7936 RepID=A0A0E9RDF3_ANGAN
MGNYRGGECCTLRVCQLRRSAHQVPPART